MKSHPKLNPKTLFDIVVIGSGPAGESAANPLVKAGLKVAIIDGGLDSKKQDKKHTEKGAAPSFTSNAHDLFHLSSYVAQKTNKLLELQSNIEIIQSLAKGGLSEIWHGICDYFSQEELEKVGLPPKEIKKEYEEIANRIKLKNNAPLDLHSKLILESAKKRPDLKCNAYKLPLASSYRASNCLEKLKRFKNFQYIPNQLTSTIKSKTKYVEVHSTSIDKSEKSTIKARYLILAAGSINTTRILLRSMNLFGYKTTFLTKAHFITPCLHLKTLLKKRASKKLSWGQAGIASKQVNQGLENFFIQLYRVNPLVLHKALEYIPLPKKVALFILSLAAPYLIIADIRFPAFTSAKKFCRLKKKGKKDYLEIYFQETSKELKSHKREHAKICRQLRSLALFPLKTITDYSTVHYAGGVPFSDKQKKLSVNSNGRVHNANRVFVADSSTWRALPAKSPTLTIMANASWVAKNVLKKFNRSKNLYIKH